MLPLPFPQRFGKPKLDFLFGKFLDVLNKLHVNIPFIDALSQIPLYAKFFKEIHSKKRKIDEHEIFSLGKECSAVVLNKLPTSLKDLSSFSIPCLLITVSIDRVLCDLGSSISLMPYSIVKRLDLQELRPTNVSLQLANRSIEYPLSILETFLLRWAIFI